MTIGKRVYRVRFGAGFFKSRPSTANETKPINGYRTPTDAASSYS